MRSCRTSWCSWAGTNCRGTGTASTGSASPTLMVVLVPGMLALVFGWLAFRSRVTGVYLSIITQALTYALLLAFFRNDMGFGGNNGMTDFKDILGFNVQADATRCGAAGHHRAVPVRAVPGGAVRGDVALRQGADRRARRREPHAVPRLPAGILQAGRLGAVGGDGRHRRRAVRAAGRHHQPARVLARQLDRGGDLGRGRRPRHAGPARSSARCWSISARPSSPAPSRNSGCSRWARCSSSSRCSCRAASWACSRVARRRTCRNRRRRQPRRGR